MDAADLVKRITEQESFDRHAGSRKLESLVPYIVGYVDSPSRLLPPTDCATRQGRQVQDRKARVIRRTDSADYGSTPLSWASS